MKFRKKPVVVEATQWFKNGDHPQDYDGTVTDPLSGVEYPSQQRRDEDWEGGVVRRFNRPDKPGHSDCQQCIYPMGVHGWIDTKEGGHIVCPTDWIITGVQGERYPCKPDIFAATYEPAE